MLSSLTEGLHATFMRCLLLFQCSNTQGIVNQKCWTQQPYATANYSDVLYCSCHRTLEFLALCRIFFFYPIDLECEGQCAEHRH